MVHKPEHKVHSFRGLLGDGDEDHIYLERQNANIAYRIVKLQIIGVQPSTVNSESTVKIYKEPQSSITDTIDLKDSTLLAVAYRETYAASSSNEPEVIIFDRELFSQDIYITHENTESGVGCNYYLEIEEVPVGAATLMQLKLGTARRLIGGSMGK